MFVVVLRRTRCRYCLCALCVFLSENLLDKFTSMALYSPMQVEQLGVDDRNPSSSFEREAIVRDLRRIGQNRQASQMTTSSKDQRQRISVKGSAARRLRAEKVQR